MTIRIAAVSKQPELAPLVGEWRVNAFFNRPGGCTVEEMAARILKPPGRPNETFVLFDGDRPVGTAGLMRSDLKCRPDLTSWLGGLYVEPAFRGRGHATALVRQVEDFARAVLVPVLWLHTIHRWHIGHQRHYHSACCARSQLPPDPATNSPWFVAGRWTAHSGRRVDRVPPRAHPAHPLVVTLNHLERRACHLRHWHGRRTIVYQRLE
jgi:GNAT superfamily N-acetyltransferase